MIRRICRHGAQRLQCRVEDCHHTPCEHGKVANRCPPCKWKRSLIVGLPRDDAEQASKKDQHRARFRAEPVVCVWGMP